MVEIRKAQLSEVRPVVSMLNQATLDLMEKGIRHWRYPWPTAKVKQQIGLQQRYLLIQGQDLLGSFTLASRRHYEEFTLANKGLILSELILMPEAQTLDNEQLVIAYATEQAVINKLDLYLASPVKEPGLMSDLDAHHFELWDRSPSTYLYRYY